MGSLVQRRPKPVLCCLPEVAALDTLDKAVEVAEEDLVAIVVVADKEPEEVVDIRFLVVGNRLVEDSSAVAEEIHLHTSSSCCLAGGSFWRD